MGCCSSWFGWVGLVLVICAASLHATTLDPPNPRPHPPPPPHQQHPHHPTLPAPSLPSSWEHDRLLLSRRSSSFNTLVPRFDFHGGHLGEGFTPSKSYFQSLIVIGIPFAVIGAFGFLSACVVVAWKIYTIQQKNRGNLQMTNQFDVSQRGGIFFVTVSAILVGVCVGLLGANTVFHGSMKDLSVLLVDSADEMLVKGMSTMGLIEKTNLTMITSTHNIMMIYDITKMALEELVHHRTLFNDAEEVRYACIASSCAIIIVGSMVVIHVLLQGHSSVSGSFSLSATYGKQAMVGVLGWALLQGLMWTGMGLHTSVAVLSADLCDAANNLDQSMIMPISVAADADPGIVGEYVDYFTLCNSSSPFADAFVAGYGLVDSLEQKINASIANHGDPEFIAVMANNTQQLKNVLDSLSELFACDYLSAIYFAAREIVCDSSLKSGYVAAATLGLIGLMTLIVLAYVCHLLFVDGPSRPQYTLVIDE